MYNTIYDAWDHKLYSIVTLKINSIYTTTVFYDIPCSTDIKTVEVLKTKNWFKHFLNHRKMIKKYAKNMFVY